MPVRTATILMWAACGSAFAVLSTAALAQPKPQALPTCTSSGQTLGLDLSTGTGPLNPPPGRLDPRWSIQATVDVFSTKPGPWFVPPPGSRWIQRSTAGNPVPAPATTGLPAVYFARFLTPQPGNSYQSLTINGIFGVDNNGTVKLRTPTATSTLAACTNCFGSPTSIPPPPKTLFSHTPDPSFGGRFLNVFMVEVTNLGGPSGLLVRAAVNAVCP